MLERHAKDLVQAAWAYHLHPTVGPALAVRQRGQSPAVGLHALLSGADNTHIATLVERQSR